MGWKDKNRQEQPQRQPPFAPIVRPPVVPSISEPLVPLPQKPSVYTPLPAPTPKPSVPIPITPNQQVDKEIAYSIQPRWCIPKPGCPEKWRNVNAYYKAFLFPGMKHEIRPRKPGDPGEYRDAIPGECIVLYKNTTVGEPGNPSGSVFVDDTTEMLFRQHFTFNV